MTMQMTIIYHQENSSFFYCQIVDERFSLKKSEFHLSSHIILINLETIIFLVMMLLFNEIRYQRKMDK